MIATTGQIITLVCVLVSYGCVSQNTANFATSNYYVNLKVMTNESDLYLPLYISKETSLMSARMKCAAYCAGNDDCLAFNFYSSGESYVCEIVPDNLCTNRADKAFVVQADCLVFDKLKPPYTKSCIDTLASSGQGISCNLLRPGCLGTWPNCNSCPQTCIDCFSRNMKSCVMWPDGSGQTSVPIMGQCDDDKTVLMIRKLNTGTGEVLQSYRMALYDMHRINRLKVYTIMSFYFTNAWGQRLSKYRNGTVDADGILRGLVYVPNPVSIVEKDIFDLDGQALSPAPFVEVTDDRYGCGSFWLLDPNNATYCPGGETAIFGKPRFDGAKVVSSGITCAKCSWGGLVSFGRIVFMK